MRNKVINTIGIILLGLVLFSSIFYIRSNRPMKRAEKEAVAIAQQYTDLEEVEDFYWFTRENTYFSVTGSSKTGKKIAVIIPKDGGKVVVLNQKDGFSENDILKKVIKEYQPDKITKVNLGIYRKDPAWEVVVENEQKTFTYYLFDYKKGELLAKINNV